MSYVQTNSPCICDHRHKLIVLAFAITGTNEQPVVLNDVEIDYQSYGYERQYFKTEEQCKEQGQAYVDSMSGVRVVYSCVKVR